MIPRLTLHSILHGFGLDKSTSRINWIQVLIQCKIPRVEKDGVEGGLVLGSREGLDVVLPAGKV